MLKKIAAICNSFTKIHSCSAALCADLLYWIASRSDIKHWKYG